MSDFGSILREAREAKGLSLEQVKEETRIRRAFLAALEEGRFSDLPGIVYARGFIRSYARFLGLDEEELITVYNHEIGEAKPTALVVLNEPLVRHARPSIWSRLFLIVMVLLVVVLGGWYAYNRLYLGVNPLPIRAPRITVPFMSPTTAVPTQVPPEPTMTAQPTPTESSQELITEPTDEPSLTPGPIETPVVRLSPTAVVDPARTPSPTPRPTSAPEQPDGVVIQAQLLAPTYVEVSADGAETFAGILNTGISQTWQARERLDMLIGNAGGIRLTVNGVELDLLGAEGEVVSVSYTPETLP